MHRYIQLGIHVKGFYSTKYERFQREITQVVEFYVDDEENQAKANILYQRDLAGNERYNNPTSHLIDYLASQGVVMREDPFIPKDAAITESTEEASGETDNTPPVAPAAPQVSAPAQATNVPPKETPATEAGVGENNNNGLEIVDM